MIKSWIFEFFATPPQLIEHFDPALSLRHFDGYLDAWTSAEAAGFEGIFFSEHHFGTSYSPSPNLLIAAVAARTKSLRLGVMGMVPPYHSPWRLVEEIGMLDHLTGGRLEIGTSPGIPPEMAQVGLSVEEARARYDEAAKAGRKARPDDLCLRRQVVMDDDAEALAKRRVAYREFLKFDPRLNLPDRPALDTPLSHSFTIGDEEFIGGDPAAIAEQIATQCRSAGAGHFAGLFDRLISPAQTMDIYRKFGEAVIPRLRAAPV